MTLEQQVLRQMEYYFSDANYAKDKFMQRQTEEHDGGFIPLDVLFTFKKLAALTTDPEVVQNALQRSTQIEMNSTKDGVRRRHPLPLSALKKQMKHANSRKERRGPRNNHSTTVIDIPKGIPCGLVVGKGGAVIKTFQANNNIYASVDGEKRQVIFRGPPESVDAAIQDLEVVFKRILKQVTKSKGPNGSKGSRGDDSKPKGNSNGSKQRPGFFQHNNSGNNRSFNNNNNNRFGDRDQRTKEIAIPDDVLAGAVIGKNGAVMKGLQKKYNVRAIVNVDERKVVMRGAEDMLEQATKELEVMMGRLKVAEFAINVHPEFRALAARDGPAFNWMFIPTGCRPSDADVEAHPFELLKGEPVGEEDQDVGGHEDEEQMWIRSFDSNHLLSLAGQLDEFGSVKEHKLCLTFGQLFFRLLNDATRDQPAFSWNQLRKLQRREDFISVWSNALTKKSFKLNSLLTLFEIINPSEVRHKIQLNVHVRSVFEKRNCTFKYRLQHGRWKLQKMFDRGNIRAMYDLIFDDKLSFRIRAALREPTDEKKWKEIGDHLHAELPHVYGNLDDSDESSTKLRRAAFATDVVLDDQAPIDFRIEGFMVKHKIKVTLHGLKFTLSYLDAQKKEFGLECRLDEKGLDSECGQAFVLLIQRVFMFLIQSYDADGA